MKSMNSLKFVNSDQFYLALKEAEKGAMIIGESPAKEGSADRNRPVILHYYNGNYYTNYGLKVDTNNPIFYEMNWNIFSTADETSLPAIELIHKMSDTKVGVNYQDCIKESTKRLFNHECFHSMVNKQTVIVNTTRNDYMLNIVRLLYTVKYALDLDIYDHIYVFIKDEWLYKDTAKNRDLVDIFEVSEDSKITFIIVREGANCIGFFGNIFDVREGNRILRIYDQRVTENVEENDIISHYYHAQQDRDDCIYFHSIYNGDNMNEVNLDEIRNISWIDISSRDIYPIMYYHKTLINLMDMITNGIHSNDIRVHTDINYSVLSEI